jgi:hypothetical protein
MQTLIQNLNYLQSFLNEMNESSSGNHKIATIHKHDDSEFLKKVFQYTYNPFKKYGVHTKVLKKNSHLVASFNLYEDIFQLLDDLAENNLTGHSAIQAVNSFVNELPTDLQKLVHYILDRDLRMGASITSVLKVHPNIIPIFKVALAHPYSPTRVDFTKEEWIGSRKLDGCLHGDSIIEFEDGKKLKIKDVVNSKIKGNVKSYNTKTKKIEYKPIIDWMINLEDINRDNNEWFEITLENNKKIILTGNHRVWLPELRCWRRADELEGNEKLLIN